MWKWFKWILISVGAIIVILLVIGFFFFPPEKNKTAENAEEMPTITSNFVDLKVVAAITKFRSCQGHLVVPQDGSETKRNMKHYFYLKKEYTAASKMVSLFSPIDGYVSDIYSDFDGEGRQTQSSDISIAQGKGFRQPWAVTLMHVIPKDGLKKGDEVKAGDFLGFVALDVPPLFAFDVVYARMANFPKTIDNWRSPYAELDSVFNHMNDEVLQEYYKTLNVSSKDDFIISKEERDSNPCKYEDDGPRFDPSGDPNQRKNDFVGKLEE